MEKVHRPGTPWGMAGQRCVVRGLACWLSYAWWVLLPSCSS